MVTKMFTLSHDDYAPHCKANILECHIFYTFIVVCWTAEENTNVLGGQVNSAGSVRDCQSACINNASCNGVDWNPLAQAGQKCWLSGPWSGAKRDGQAKGITHYNLNRTCTGKNSQTRL